MPVIEHLLDCFPFIIKGFYSDNGSEHINYKVEVLLKKLLIDKPNHASDRMTLH